MTDAPTLKNCVDCGPRAVHQFRRRPGGRLNSRCRRCTKLATRQAARLEREAQQ